MPHIVPFLVIAYLVGSIPTAYWYGKWFHNVDIRQHGSGNSGATNSLRVLGKKAGIIVLLIDVFKGFIIISILSYLGWKKEDQLLVGLAAIIGHLLPIFANFKGGKGIATSYGIIIGLNPIGALICLGVFLVVVKWSSYVSLGSLLGSLSFVIFAFIRYGDQPFFPIVCIFLFLLLCYTHRKNIGRLLKGVENKYPPSKS